MRAAYGRSVVGMAIYDTDGAGMSSLWATSPAVRRSMIAKKRKDTAPELALRRALHAKGVRYRVDVAPLVDLKRRRADIVFHKARVAIFVDGCFWHGCPEHYIPARTNASYWATRIERNRQRDICTNEALLPRCRLEGAPHLGSTRVWTRLCNELKVWCVDVTSSRSARTRDNADSAVRTARSVRHPNQSPFA